MRHMPSVSSFLATYTFLLGFLYNRKGLGFFFGCYER